MKKYLGNCFWFFIPVILFDIIFFQYLPEQYQRNYSHPISVFENITRIILIIISIISGITIKNKTGKIGIIIYIIGILIYFGSYFVEIYFSNTLFGKNLIVLIAPFWTSVIWLTGIGLIGNKLLIKIPYHYMVYIVLSIMFGIFHSGYGYNLLAKP